MKLSLLGAFALTIVSCGASTKPEQSELARTSEADAGGDSGKRLSGDFALIAVEDAYRFTNSQPAQTTFSFDEKGSFKRHERSGSDEGSYLIAAKNELLIYVEKVNGEPLAAARVERYVIVEQAGDSMTLECASQKLLFRKVAGR